MDNHDVLTGEALTGPGQAMKSAFFYGRYSDLELQTNDSIEQQLRACREDALRSGRLIPDDSVFADRGVRGWKQSRPELDRLLRFIEENPGTCTDLYIFDTSRLARDRELAAKMEKFFKFHRVCVRFVANGMSSDSEGFGIQHAFLSAFDQQFSLTLGKHVTRGQIHKFESGYLAGPRCYGYVHEPDIDPAYSDSYDRRRRRGVFVRVNPIEAEVIRLIFRMYCYGIGYDAIARHLNEMGIRSPRRPTKNNVRAWSASSVRTILANQRYIGIVRRGVTESVKHPETNKIVNRKRPESEWRTYYAEELRIVSDEEFQEIAKRRAKRSSRAEQRKTGGLNKAKGIYPWSGLLRCSCGGQISICQNDTYMCVTAYKGAGCKNSLKLNRPSFEREMIEFLVRQLREARSFDSMVDALMQEINLQQRVAEKLATEATGNREAAQVALRQLEKEIGGLAETIAVNGHSPSLWGKLREREAKQLLLQQQIKVWEPNTLPPLARGDVADFVSNGLSDMADILMSDPKLCREEIRKRVDHLILTPREFEGRPAYEISGDLRLFADQVPKMLSCSGHITAKHFGLCLNLNGATLKLEPNGRILRIAQVALNLRQAA